MKTKKAPLEPLPLWQQAELSGRGELETSDGPLLAEFSVLAGLMDTHPDLMDRREVSGENVELTPNVRFMSLRDARGKDKTIVLPAESPVPDSRQAQAHRLEGSKELYLALSSSDVSGFRQFTIHDGHITDIGDSDKQLGAGEIATVKAALDAISETLESNLEEKDRRRISRKIGAWWKDSDGKRANRRADRQAQRDAWLYANSDDVISGF